MLKLLDGFRVLDLCRLAAGAPTKLADLGAEVIKVEEPPYGDYLRGLPPIMPDSGVALFYEMINRNKKSLGLNLKADEGRRIFFELLQTADAVVEISKPGTFERLGLDYESLRPHKPDLVYCSITGYGQTGPYRALPSHGMNIDATAGLLEIDHRPGQRPEIRVGSAQGLEVGSAHAALGIVAGLLQRSRTGEGCYIDAACWESAVSVNRHAAPAINLPALNMRFEDPLRPGGIGPKYNVYGTKDDKVVLICPIEKKFWAKFCAVVGHEEWIDRGHYGDLPMDYGESDPILRDDIEAVMRTRTRDEWVATLLAADVPVSPVLTAGELVDDPHVAERGMVVPGGAGDSRRYVRLPLLVDGRAAEVSLPAPALGSHTDEIMAGLGYGPEERGHLRNAGIIAGPAGD
ncbi:MAG TPA: CaiB/BaiF CoA-transferase family protein [Acidimicrobiia bacterium]|nr:CaiB/BaiF CoA-transferase family protein [Acidimicrobiia bacterium]